jgi:eukaryotic-like serine/threonine-protein kinase
MTTPAERWTVIQGVLATVLDLPVEERAAQLAVLCGDDADLLDEVERLLRACTAAEADVAFLSNVAEYAWPLVADLERMPDVSVDACSLRERLAGALDRCYRIERALGSGGMAMVFLATDLRHERHVAIKVMQPGVLAGASAERFLREIRVVAGLTHPHILSLHDSGQAAGLLYHVSAYIEGESLRARLRREGPLPVRDVLRVMRGVASALEYAHRHGIVHRDIKPENVLIQDGHAIVADFGIARAFGHALGENTGGNSASTITQEGLRLGTPAYMAPEQVTGNSAIDQRADLYALGVIAHEMLAGAHPFADGTPEQMIIAQLTLEPERLERPEVPSALADLVQRLLAKRPEDRIQSAEQLLAELERVSTEAQSTGTATAPRAGADPQESFAIGATRQRASPGRRLAPPGYTRAAAVAVVLLLFAVPAFMLGRSDAAQAGQAILVLPYHDQTGEATNNPLGRVVADWIAHGLGRTAVGEIILHPVGASASDPAAAVRNPRALARKAGAAYYVQGSITRVGDSLYVHTTIGKADGRVVARIATVGLRPEDLLGAVREQTVGAVAAALDARLAPMMDAGIRPPAYGAYLAYVEALEKLRRSDAAGAAEELIRATELDTSFVQALFMLATIGWADESQLERVHARAEHLTPYERVDLERLMAGARLDIHAELAAARRLTAMAPRTPEARMSHAGAALRAGYFREALSAIRALERQPGRMLTLEAFYHMAGEVHHAVGDYAGELRIARLAPQRLGESSSLNCLSGVQALAALGRAAALDSAAVACAGLRDTGHPLALRPFIMAAREARAHGHPELAEWIARRGIAWFETGLHHSGGSAGVPPSGPLANIYAEAGDTYREYEIIQALWPSSELATAAAETRCRFAIAAARSGDATTAERLAAEMGARRPASEEGGVGDQLLCRARLAATLGQREEAVRLLSLAVPYSAPAYLLHRAGDLQTLIGYPPFDALIRSRD